MSSTLTPNGIFEIIFRSLTTKINQDNVLPTHHSSSAIRRLPDVDKGKVQAALTTLHFLFPHEVLPALDLLDRGLLICLHTGTDTRIDGLQAETYQMTRSSFYVQSASAATNIDGQSSSTNVGRFRKVQGLSPSHYEVNIDGWNCSCPAFAFHSMKAIVVSDQAHLHRTMHVSNDPQILDPVNRNEEQFGGTATRHSSVAPVCKHILAVVLAVHAPGLFASAVQYRSVSQDEYAAWAAGWGE